MSMISLRRRLAVATVICLAVVACGDDTTATTMHMDEHDEEFHFGEPADSADADRVIEVTTTNDLTFEPAEFTVAEGEVITFRISNDGDIEHDFVIGDEEAQTEHEAEMEEMRESGEMTMHDDPNAVEVPSGGTAEITWHFTEAGTVLIGCHVKGHYDAGMKATITVQ